VEDRIKALTCPVCGSTDYTSFGWSVTFDGMMEALLRHAREEHPGHVRDVGGITYIDRIPMVGDCE
jgi:hypothetical protein